LEKSRVHKRIDDKPVWSVPCTFIAKDFRRQGVSVALLKGLVKYAKENGIKIIEAYPTIPTQGKLPDASAWVGLYKYRLKEQVLKSLTKHRKTDLWFDIMLIHHFDTTSDNRKGNH
jgi:predicted GNAT family acetyltransferase